MSSKTSLSLYAENATMMAQKFEGISAADHLAPVIDLLPALPAKIADIGAGSGRDAAWLAQQGYDVIAVEPVAELRAEAKVRHAGAKVEWLDDSLPDLPALQANAPLDAVLLSGVWHHVAPADRGAAMRSFAELLNPGGVVIIAIRQGPIDPERGLYDSDPLEAIEAGKEAGFQAVAERDADAARLGNPATGVLGRWLVLRKY